MFIPKTPLFIIASMVPLLGGCQSLTPSTNLVAVTSTPTPSRIKKVEISITRPSGGSSTVSSSYSVGPKAKPDVKVDWNGYGFLIKSDSGQTLSQISDDLAFKNNKASFTLKKTVTITESQGGASGSTSLSTSRAIEVKRGVKATF